MVREVYEAQQQIADNSADNSTGNSTDNSANSTGGSSSNGTQLLSQALPLLLREHEYWTTGDKAVTVLAADGSRHNLSRCAYLRAFVLFASGGCMYVCSFVGCVRGYTSSA
jgi:hypothetical protein